MPKTALVILSSPRKGSNSSALGQAVAEGFTRAGGEAECLDLSRLDIKPCLACNACQRNGGRCAQIDGMFNVYPKIKTAAVLVLATPVYWFSMSAQLKIFLDRCYALLAPTEDGAPPLAGKTLAAALSYGDKDLDSSGARNAIRIFEDICHHCQAAWGGFVHGSATERDTFVNDQKILGKARALGKKLFGS